MTTTQPLPTFEGLDVQQAKVKITNAGDGLSEALKVAPVALELGDEPYYLLRGEVTQINHVEKDELITRVHTVKASAITPVDPELASKMLEEAAAELAKAKAAADGQLMLDAENEALAKEALD